MTGEEKFKVDLEGYLVIKNVLTDDEVAEMNDIIDNSERQGPPSLWGEPFKRLIDHPKILPYLLDLLGPHVRLDHDYAIFMEAGPHINGLHGGEDGGGPGGPRSGSLVQISRRYHAERIVCDDLQSGGCSRRCGWILLYSGKS